VPRAPGSRVIDTLRDYNYLDNETSRLRFCNMSPSSGKQGTNVQLKDSDAVGGIVQVDAKISGCHLTIRTRRATQDFVVE